jgi:transposase
MAAAIGLRDDYGSAGLRAAAKRSKDGPQARRLLAVAAMYDGATRTEAAKIGGVGLQVVRDWVVKFNAQGPDGLIDRKAPGQPPRLNDAHRAALVAIISGPIPAIHGVVRWRIVDLCQWIFEEFRVVVSEQTTPGRDQPREGRRSRRHASISSGAVGISSLFSSTIRRPSTI